jgi:hypothetical protein
VAAGGGEEEREGRGWRGWATAQPTPSPSVLSETHRGGLFGPKGADNSAPGISGQEADIPACCCHSRSKLFEIKLVCKIECFRGEGGLGLDKVTAVAVCDSVNHRPVGNTKRKV